jgi:hypothetical protein
MISKTIRKIIFAMRPRILTVLSFVVAVLTAAPANADQVYWSTESMLKDFFKRSDRVAYVRLESEGVRQDLRALLGSLPGKLPFLVFVAYSGTKIDGYAVIDDEPGEHLPITLGMKLSPEGTIERAEVMVYREQYGSEVKEQRFRDQFVGKRSSDPIRLGDDIAAISGATISSKAMVLGVRRALALVSIVKRHALDAAAPAGR